MLERLWHFCVQRILLPPLGLDDCRSRSEHISEELGRVSMELEELQGRVSVIEEFAVPEEVTRGHR